MNIAQRNQQRIKDRIAKGEKVEHTAPDYNKAEQQSKGVNPAQRFKKSVLAKQVKALSHDLNSAENVELNKEYDIVKASLDGDIVTLKGLKTIAEKLAYKAHIIPNYLDYLQQYQAQGHNHPNGILSQVMVWLFDTEQFELAHQYAELAIEQGQKLPARFNTPNIQTFICDTLADYGAKQLKDKKPAPALQYAIDGLSKHWDVNPIPAGKVFATAGKLEFMAKNYQTAFDYCNKALELNERAGVKKLLSDITALLAGLKGKENSTKKGSKKGANAKTESESK